MVCLVAERSSDLISPVFNRAVVTLPRRARHFIYRAAYPAALFTLMLAAWQVLAGTQVIRNVGDFSRFGAMLFQLLAPVQLALALFASALLAAGSIAAEKDRRTLDLLLLTNLSSAQFVLGKLFGSLLLVWTLLAGALPLFVFALLFGGVAGDQLFRASAVTFSATLLAGSLGALLALWRDKTFQTLAMTTTLMVLWLVFWELMASGLLGNGNWGSASYQWAVAFSPWRAILAATLPSDPISLGGERAMHNALWFLPVSLSLAAAFTTWGIIRFRVWNPSQTLDASSRPIEDREVGPAGRSLRSEREVWANPIIWREVRTWAYGQRTMLVRIAYFLLFVLAAGATFNLQTSEMSLTRITVATVLIPLFVLSLLLINAQAVTSITTERDGRALDLLLVTDLTPKEFIFGKLGGVLYNTKEMIVAPIALCVALWAIGGVTLENLTYLTVGQLSLIAFAAMLGVHAGMTYGHSPTAIAVSLGAVFFLFIGIAACMRVMVAFSGSFEVQLAPFVLFMFGGGVGLFFALGVRNPSTALLAASLLCPFVTFYAITSFLLGQTLNVFIVITAMYSFATAAMLIPAIYEFDVAAGRTTSAQE
jgi:ABC-type Na+ efflux pump permease subunit